MHRLIQDIFHWIIINLLECEPSQTHFDHIDYILHKQLGIPHAYIFKHK